MMMMILVVAMTDNDDVDDHAQFYFVFLVFPVSHKIH